MAFAMRLPVLFGIALATLGVAAPPDLSSLLAHMRERAGPVWATPLESRSELYGHHEPYHVRTRGQGLRFASYQCAEALCEGTYFDGERVETIDINGTALPDVNGADPYLRAERTISSLAFLAPDFSAQGGKIFDDGYTAISGVPYRTLLIANGDAVPMHVFIDPKRYDVIYARDINGDNTYQFSDYQRIGGRLWLPMEVRRNGALLERYDERKIADTPFTPPHGPLASFSNGPVTLPTEPRQVLPIVPCTLGGIATHCLLDSGNSGLSISLALSERLGLPALGSFQVRGLGDYSTEVVRAGPLALGSMTLAPADYVVLPDMDVAGYDVVLGADLFAATTVGLDGAQHTVTLGAPAPAGGVTVPIAFEDLVPVVGVQLGSLPTQLAVDTGDESSINLAYDFYQQHHDLFSATSERPVSGVGGTSIELLGTIGRVSIGGFAITSPAIGATRTLHGTAYGHVGVGLLSRYDVTLDYANGELHLSDVAAAGR